MKKNNISPQSHIIVRGARQHNLKNIDINLPKNKLIVITGLSGSGKSSLAFDTIYAEGQKRYLDSLSSYARQFLGNSNKPDVDSIEGLSPSISIDQKSTSHNPRSTVGTVTEIYDYLRLLYARIGTPTCKNGHGSIETMTIKKICDQIFLLPDGEKMQILAPIARQEKGTFKNEIEKFRRQGFLRIMIDNVVYSLDDKIELKKNEKHNIWLVIDRIVLAKNQEIYSRLYSSIETAVKETNGLIDIQTTTKMFNYSLNHSCKICGFSISELEPRLFSFNSPIGACSECKGLGFTFEPDEEKIFPNPNLSIFDGGIDYFKNTVNTSSLDWQRFECMFKHYKIDLMKPIKNLTAKEIKYIINGSDEPINLQLISSTNKMYESIDYVEGVGNLIKRRHQETQSESARDYYIKYMSEKTCDKCKGQRLSQEALCVLLNDKNIIELTQLNIQKTIDFIKNLQLSDEQKQVGKLLLKEIINRLTFLENVGIGYLNLARKAATLSGGELQRIRLASQIGSSLTGVLYVLDEPSIGLHQKDNFKLIETMKKIRDLGNTVLVVEHDEETMLESDWLIDIGPEAGFKGGELVAEGTPDEVANNIDSITGRYLSGKQKIALPNHRREGNKTKKLVLKGATANNLKKVDVTIPLNKLVAITGVSGSGKSTLINEVLLKALDKEMYHPFQKTVNYEKLEGWKELEQIIQITQNPIGRTPRSNPATYVGLFDPIRDKFALLPESRARGYLKGRFSFNVKGGRCDKCEGDGVIKIEMHFLPDVFIECDECHGKKYNDETLAVKYKGKSIYDVLNMQVDEALEFFADIPAIATKLQIMHDVGIGYLKLGANSNHLSGGEAQRIKLAKFLQRKTSKQTLFVLDEPTTGLHTHDISNLVKILNRIVDNGDSVIVIEHNLELIKMADYIIDLGPEGGDGGGKIVATGTPEELCSNYPDSYTAKYLLPYLYK